MKIALGSDHAGLKLKRKIIEYLKRNEIFFKDYGTFSEDSCDYTDYAFPVAKAVAGGGFERGILVCGSGVGMAVAANRFKKIRAVNVNDFYTARQSREHGDANVLCLAGKKLRLQKALQILKIWLTTPFSGDERHRRRIGKLSRFGSA